MTNIKFQIFSIFLLNSIAVLGSVSVATAAYAEENCDQNILKSIQGKVVLPENCTYQRPIQITEGNTTLDCRGSTFIGDGRAKIGLLIDSKGKPMSDVVVKNCNFQNFESSGVRVTWSEKDVNKGSDHREIYSRSPTRVLLDNITVENSGRVGVYIDDYATNVTLQNSTVRNSGGPAVYLEFSSKKSRIMGNKFIENGLRDEGGIKKREALAVDSSSENVIEGNLFKGNAAGGIFLYKNCSERFGTGEQAIRWMPSNKNIISGNTFLNEKIGVWLASRQSKDLSKWGCGDVPMEKSRSYYQDFANSNEVLNNTFCRTDVPIRNEGDNNSFVGNKFDLRANVTVEQPVSMRQKFLGKPTTGTLIEQSKAINCDKV